MREAVRIGRNHTISDSQERTQAPLWASLLTRYAEWAGTAFRPDYPKNMPWTQTLLELEPRSRGFHLITHEVQAAIGQAISSLRVGLVQLFLQHTSASLSINENADADVPRDLESSFNAIAPESFPHRHTCEGPDDMPAHVKASLLGCSLVIPVRDGRLCLGTWQGVYLCEHRNRGGRRRIVATVWGE
jgi:secondary thiamine-phosphate synthase enzyme